MDGLFYFLVFLTALPSLMCVMMRMLERVQVRAAVRRKK